MSVAKYHRAHESFISTVDREIVEINLAEEGLSESQAKRRIRNNNPSSVYCIGTRAYVMASQELRTQNIVMSSAINWQRLPTRQNTRVISDELPAAYQLTLYRLFFPDVKRIGILCSKEFNQEWAEQAIAAGLETDAEIVVQYIKKKDELAAAMAELLPKVDALWLTADPTVIDEKTLPRIFSQTNAARKPVFTFSAAFESYGAALMISPDDQTIGRQAAGLLGNDVDEYVQTPAGSEVTLNMNVVKKFGLTFNEDALDYVNRIIR
jgi:putative ABC transport system substrate-binding protein